MICTATLFNETSNKIIKTENISRDTYALCEEAITERNLKLKYPKKWVITSISN